MAHRAMAGLPKLKPKTPYLIMASSPTHTTLITASHTELATKMVKAIFEDAVQHTTLLRLLVAK